MFPVKLFLVFGLARALPQNLDRIQSLGVSPPTVASDVPAHPLNSFPEAVAPPLATSRIPVPLMPTPTADAVASPVEAVSDPAAMGVMGATTAVSPPLAISEVPVLLADATTTDNAVSRPVHTFGYTTKNSLNSTLSVVGADMNTTTIPSPTTPLTPLGRWNYLHPQPDLAKCLDSANGTVHVSACMGSVSQKWVVDQGYTFVQAYGTAYCLAAVYDAAMLRKCDGSLGQMGYHKYGFFRTVGDSKQCLTLESGKAVNGTVVMAVCDWTSDAQVWNEGEDFR